MILTETAKGYEGRAFYSDGDEVVVEPYNGLDRKYFCGREYQKYAPVVADPYLLVVIDAREASIGTTDGERVTVLWSDTSLVPGKHGHGGQSQARFQRGREEALKQWLRKVLDILVSIAREKQGSGDFARVIVGGAGMTKNAFVNEMPAWLQQRIARVSSVGYTDENGLWELIGKSRYQ